MDNDDMNIDYEATSDEEECGPSSEEEVAIEQQRLATVQTDS